MAVDRPARRSVSPHVSKQLRAGEHAARVRGQASQQLELLRGQLHAALVDEHLAGAEIDLELPNTHHSATARSLRPAQKRSHPGTQLRVAVRLADYFGSRGRVRPDPSRDWVIAGLLAQHQRLLDESVISAEVAAERGYWSAIKSGELNGRFGGEQKKLVPALVIPVLNTRGMEAFCQLRPDDVGGPAGVGWSVPCALSSPQPQCRCIPLGRRCWICG